MICLTLHQALASSIIALIIFAAIYLFVLSVDERWRVESARKQSEKYIKDWTK